MEIARETDSLEVITEVDPLQIAEIFGNVGGFWGELSNQPYQSRVCGGVFSGNVPCLDNTTKAKVLNVLRMFTFGDS